MNQPKKTLKKSVTSLAAKRLATVPDASYLDTYISRSFPDGQTEFDIFEYALKTSRNVLIEGPTGPGKTSAALAYAAKADLPFYAIPSNVGIEASQLFGKYIPSTDGGFRWVDGPVTDVVRNGGLLLINEVNFIPERVSTILFGLLDKRRQIVLLDHEGEVINAHPNLLVMADMNPDYEGTRPLNKAFRNRFSVQLWWDYDDNVESRLTKSPSLREMAKKMRAEVQRGTFDTPISTNMLQEFESMTKDIGIDFAEMNFVNHFSADDRQVVRNLLQTYRDNIVRDLTPVSKETPEDEVEEIVEELESIYPDDHPIWETRLNAPQGYEDPEWGIKGTDWDYETNDDNDDETDEED